MKVLHKKSKYCNDGGFEFFHYYVLLLNLPLLVCTVSEDSSIINYSSCNRMINAFSYVLRRVTNEDSTCLEIRHRLAHNGCHIDV